MQIRPRVAPALRSEVSVSSSPLTSRSRTPAMTAQLEPQNEDHTVALLEASRNGQGEHSLLESHTGPRFKIVILGLSLTSSSAGNHSATYRGLVRELSGRGHDVLFLERGTPRHAAKDDLPA